MAAFRTVLFNICFYLNTVLHMIVCLPVLALPRPALWRAVASWTAVNLWCLSRICRIRFEFYGTEKIPPGPLIVASKHQSTGEIYALLQLFPDPVYVLKRELMWIPIFGWYCLKARMIPVRRGARSVTMAEMARRAKEEVSGAGRQLIIFPEGTRRAADAEPAYKYGVAYLYGELGVPCIPVALNSGLFWPRRSWRMRPGRIRVDILDPIPPGLHPDAFFQRLQNELEPATTRLVALGRREIEAQERLEAFRHST
jgi:1-acyl-sn-glycerol-3-phosphate acyltransferase